MKREEAILEEEEGSSWRSLLLSSKGVGGAGSDPKSGESKSNATLVHCSS